MIFVRIWSKYSIFDGFVCFSHDLFPFFKSVLPSNFATLKLDSGETQQDLSTQIYMDTTYMEPQQRVLNHCFN